MSPGGLRRSRVPASLDLTGTGPNLGIQSHFTFTWATDLFGYPTGFPTGYIENRVYTKAGVPTPNATDITVTNINYGAGTYSVAVSGATTPTQTTTWGRLKVIYR